MQPTLVCCCLWRNTKLQEFHHRATDIEQLCCTNCWLWDMQLFFIIWNIIIWFRNLIHMTHHNISTLYFFLLMFFINSSMCTVCTVNAYSGHCVMCTSDWCHGTRSMSFNKYENSLHIKSQKHQNVLFFHWPIMGFQYNGFVWKDTWQWTIYFQTFWHLISLLPHANVNTVGGTGFLKPDIPNTQQPIGQYLTNC